MKKQRRKPNNRNKIITIDIWIVQNKETGDIITVARVIQDAIKNAACKVNHNTRTTLDRIELL